MSIHHQERRMDTLSEVLDTLHFNGCFYFTTDFTAPFGLGVPHYENVARFHHCTSGMCWIRIAGQALQLSTGDIIIIPHGQSHDISDQLDTPISTLDQALDTSQYPGHGAFKFGGDAHGVSTKLVCGHFEFDPLFSHPLLKQLPAYILLKADDVMQRSWLQDALRLLASEAQQARSGSQANVKRLSEIIFIQVLRLWQEMSGGQYGFLTALKDKQLSRSLDAFHQSYSKNWTVESLANTAGMSRTSFAERFKSLMQIAPMQYVTDWRMQQAQRRLKNTDESIERIANAIGYESVASFSKAFKRTVGANPGEFRRQL